MIAITAMFPQHWEAVKKIYEEGIATGNATFQTSAPCWEEWDAAHVATCRFVAIENDEVLGWAALTAVSGRCVYAGVAEVSVYVAANVTLHHNNHIHPNTFTSSSKDAQYICEQHDDGTGVWLELHLQVTDGGALSSTMRVDGFP